MTLTQTDSASEPEDEPELDVCQVCGRYYTPRNGDKWQRCGQCHRK